MARQLKYIWPPSLDGEVCPLQTLTTGGLLSLNTNPGGYYNPATQSIDFLQKGFSRNVSVQCTSLAQNANFSVTGTQNGQFLSETIKVSTGTKNGISKNTYDQVISVGGDQPAQGVTVSLGTRGYFPLLALNLEKDYLNYAASMMLSANSEMTYSIYYTSLNLAGNSLSFDAMIPNSNQNSSYFFFYQEVDKANFFYPSPELTPFLLLPFFLVAINSCAVTDTATLTFIQM
jgi:hypothetical protein